MAAFCIHAHHHLPYPWWWSVRFLIVWCGVEAWRLHTNDKRHSKKAAQYGASQAANVTGVCRSDGYGTPERAISQAKKGRERYEWNQLHASVASQ